MTPAIPHLIVDTDVGFDDVLAITYLLACPTVTIEAFTVVNGISDVDEGAELLLLLQEKAGIRPIPVYQGQRQPMSGSNQFPAEWRHQATLAREWLGWSRPSGRAQKIGAVDFLAARLTGPAPPAQVLAIGPLTNFAVALEGGAKASAIQTMTIMGGALGPVGAKVGNIPNDYTAEGNIYVDPVAARTVLSAGIHPALVPLNATSQVVITSDFVSSFHSGTALGGIAKQILLLIASKFIAPDQPPYNAWDPLAAMGMVVSDVLTNLANLSVEVSADGVTVTALGPPNVQVALGGNASVFLSNYQSAFQAPGAPGGKSPAGPASELRS